MSSASSPSVKASSTGTETPVNGNGNGNSNSQTPALNSVLSGTSEHSPKINPHRSQFNLLPQQLALPQPAMTSTTAAAAGNPRKCVSGSGVGSSNNKAKLKKRPQLQKSPSYYLSNPNATPTHSLSHNHLHSVNSGTKNSKYVYSVDDDTDEIEQDMEREYLEGYHDALRYRFKKSSKNLKDNFSISSGVPGVISKAQYVQQQSTHSSHHSLPHRQASTSVLASPIATQSNSAGSTAIGDVKTLTEKAYQDLQHAASNLHKLEDIEGDSIHTNNNLNTVIRHHNASKEQTAEPQDGNDGEQQQQDDADDSIVDDGEDAQEYAEDYYNEDQQQGQGQAENVEFGEDQYEQGDDPVDTRSISSEESYTLRERQTAINTTHPFGIRIWKPAIYKKIRSVDKEADVDIHEVDITKRRKITWDVRLTNTIWAFTFGVLLFSICFIGSVVLIIVGSVNYSKVFFKLGTYLLWPFGKLVYLQQDENYLSEDRNDGTTFGEYARWRDEELNKLFFSASRLNASGSNDNSDTASYLHSTDHIPTLRTLPPSSPLAATSAQAARQPRATSNRISTITEEEELEQGGESPETFKKRFFGRGDWNLGRIVFYMFFYLVLYPIGASVWLICWLMVFTIPMAKVIQTLSIHLKKHPLALFYRFDIDPRIATATNAANFKQSNVLICTYRSSGFHYYRYTVEGTNIFFINLMAVVFFTIFAFFGMKEFLGMENIFTNESVIFGLCLLSIIPLAYFIGQAVASISAQSSMGLGAVINAFFSTVVEIFLYCVALNQKKGQLVEGSMVGSILGAVLLLPGVSMCAGALKRKTQRYNPASAGVSSTMLIFSVVVMLSPTFFFQIYGNYEVECKPCVDKFLTTVAAASSQKVSCQTCQFFQPPVKLDALFNDVLKPFSIICAVLLFMAYIIGLWFTLRTHAALIWETPITEPKKQPPHLQHMESSSQIIDLNQIPQEQTAIPAAAPAAAPAPAESGGHDAPNWSKNKSTFVLLASTILYAIIAEILVDCVDSVLVQFPQLDPKFLGITIFALVPNTTEFLNAISFATHGNVALSMEIGSAYALQVALIQIPSLVLYSLFFIDVGTVKDVKDSMFTLIFPKWDLFTSIISVMLFTYIYGEGKSNYFKGSILILGYVVCVMGFFFVSVVKDQESLLGLSGAAVRIMVPNN
ncbi:hypothetical protein WICPIJ_006989 [Wickerhamomyces pijperi]|uniref:Low affinity vacuolar monovalent cation/H(+) antiporter n=1 Tax=Wickerhamomyces pijperi TaxID=599730 RepID=A0A9P8TJP4_WICPI|nr:hypothetical protein WICPIJ_006989 [Wickerhamomyces pijperi]